MRLSADRLRLVAAVSAVASADRGRGLGWLSAATDTLAISAGTAAAGARATLAADVSAPGRVVLPGLAALAHYLRNSAASTIELHQIGGVLVLRAGDAERASIPLSGDAAPEPAPEAPKPPAGAVKLEVEPGAFRAATRRVIFAARSAMPRDARVPPEGVLFVPGDGRLTLVAFDGPRLAVAHAACSLATDHPRTPAAGSLLPAWFAHAVDCFAASTCGLFGESLSLALWPAGGIARGPERECWACPIEFTGKLPDWRRVAEGFSPGAEVDPHELLAALRFVRGVITDPDESPVCLRASAGSLAVWARGETIGEARRDIPAAYVGEPSAAAFFAGDLDPVVRAAGSQPVRLSWCEGDRREGALVSAGGGVCLVVRKDKEEG